MEEERVECYSPLVDVRKMICPDRTACSAPCHHAIVHLESILCKASICGDSSCRIVRCVPIVQAVLDRMLRGGKHEECVL